MGEEMKTSLEQRAKAEGKTVTAVVTRLIEAYVAGEAVPPTLVAAKDVAKKIKLLLKFKEIDREAIEREVLRLIWLLEN